MTNAPFLLTIQEAAGILGDQVATVHRRIARGYMHAVRDEHGQMLLSADEVERWQQIRALPPGQRRRALVA